jgi:hypothetical protein
MVKGLAERIWELLSLENLTDQQRLVKLRFEYWGLVSIEESIDPAFNKLKQRFLEEKEAEKDSL